MQHTTPAARVDPHERLRTMKVVALSITGAVLAAVSWLVAGHAVGSVAQDTQPPRVYVVQREDGEHEDGEGFFLNGSSLSTGTFQVPVTRSHGS
jgi:hypothetical protein